MGILDEMMTEAVDSAMDNPDLEEEADEEVQRVLEDVLGGKYHTDMMTFPIDFFLFFSFRKNPRNSFGGSSRSYSCTCYRRRQQRIRTTFTTIESLY